MEKINVEMILKSINELEYEFAILNAYGDNFIEGATITKIQSAKLISNLNEKGIELVQTIHMNYDGDEYLKYAFKN